MSGPDASALPIDAGLRARFRSAGPKIAWRDAPPGPAGARRHSARIAHLNDEEARVESWGRPPRASVQVDSGPLGALVLVLEIDRRGLVPRLVARAAGADAAFPNGAIRAEWGAAAAATGGPTLRDLIDLARYALP